MLDHQASFGLCERQRERPNFCDGTPSESNCVLLGSTLLACQRLRPKSLLFTPLAVVEHQRIGCIYSAAPLILTCFLGPSLEDPALTSDCRCCLSLLDCLSLCLCVLGTGLCFSVKRKQRDPALASDCRCCLSLLDCLCLCVLGPGVFFCEQRPWLCFCVNSVLGP